MKLGVSFARTRPLPSRPPHSASARAIVSGLVSASGDDLDQLQVTGRVEEVRDAEAAPEVGAASLHQVGDAQARRVRRDDGAAAHLVDARVQRLLDREVFDDGLDDDVAGGDRGGQVVLQVADGDQRVEAGREERGGLRLARAFQAGGGDLVARGLVAGGRVLGGDVQQAYAEAGVRQVRRDGRSHDARSQYRHFTDRLGGHENTITENRREGRSHAFMEPCIGVGVGVRRRRRAGSRSGANGCRRRRVAARSSRGGSCESARPATRPRTRSRRRRSRTAPDVHPAGFEASQEPPTVVGEVRIAALLARDEPPQRREHRFAVGFCQRRLQPAGGRDQRRRRLGRQRGRRGGRGHLGDARCGNVGNVGNVRSTGRRRCRPVNARSEPVRRDVPNHDARRDD